MFSQQLHFITLNISGTKTKNTKVNTISSMMNHMPILGINLRVAAERGVICGHKNNTMSYEACNSIK
jgi:hypothetical protein